MSPSAVPFTIRRQTKNVQRFSEDLGNGIRLETIFIPGGPFLMGSPADEPERYDDEGPQHEATVPDFLMGRYPVTQRQWRTVATWTGFKDDLNPDPSHFKGANRPVESISWHDATAFCQRLARRTGRDYRLPSEAEWEYACRAGTTTPFHFGESITPDLANYNGKRSYGRGPAGEYRGETTEVGKFPANAFGLSDMHGNVWEWCADTWHDSYEGAPRDGSAWSDKDNSDKDILPSSDKENNEDVRYVLRGGSWLNYPRLCRSAYRNWYVPVDRVNYTGFRLACGLPRTLP